MRMTFRETLNKTARDGGWTDKTSFVNWLIAGLDAEVFLIIEKAAKSFSEAEKIKVSSHQTDLQGANSGQLQQHDVMESVCPNCGVKHTTTDCGGYCTAACLQGY